jgi:hypothetical protein
MYQINFYVSEADLNAVISVKNANHFDEKPTYNIIQIRKL